MLARSCVVTREVKASRAGPAKFDLVAIDILLTATDPSPASFSPADGRQLDQPRDTTTVMAQIPDRGLWPGSTVFVPPTWENGRSEGFVRKNALRDIVREIFAAITGLATLGPRNGVVWRGQAKTGWRVDSKLGRAVNLAGDPDLWTRHEQTMLLEARRVGADGSQHFGDLELLARLRHHGAATRLIDFTQDPMVALWFACNTVDSPDTDSYDGVVVALDKSGVREVLKPWDFSYAELKDRNTVWLASMPALDPRITAQRGLFLFAERPRTASENALSELDQVLPNTWSHHKLVKVCSPTSWANAQGQPVKNFPDMVAILIPGKAKPFLRDVLGRTYGFTRSSIYPDFPGLAQSFANP